jgi:FHS family L-fucose permease-like MFS transporter
LGIHSLCVPRLFFHVDPVSDYLCFGISGLGDAAKKASSFILVAIMGGAIMPKLMGHIADISNVSLSFVVPLCCFLCVTADGFFWSKLARSLR